MTNEFLHVKLLWGWYQYFMPSYVFSVLMSYPEAFIRFVVLDEPLPGVMAMLDRLRSLGFDRFSVIPKKRLALPEFEGTTDMYERWLLDESWFSGFDYAWIGDVDFLHIRETPSWLEREIGYSEKIGFPYSNVVRGPTAGVWSEVLTGWHFIVVKPYFEAMSPVIKEFKAKPVSMARDGVMRHAMENERLLYYLVSKGLGVPPVMGARMSHGAHLGIYRIGKGQPSYHFRDQLEAQVRDPIFAEIVEGVSVHPVMKRIMDRAVQDYGIQRKLFI